MLASPEMIVRTWREAREVDAEVAATMDGSGAGTDPDQNEGLVRSQPAITEAEVRDALLRLDPLWDKLFLVEQARIVQLLVERVDVGLEGASIRLRTNGLASLADELGRIGTRKEAA